MSELWVQLQAAILAAIIGIALVVNVNLRKVKPPGWISYSVLGINLALWEIIDAFTISAGHLCMPLIVANELTALLVPLSGIWFLKRVFNDRSRSLLITQRVFSGIFILLLVAIIASSNMGKLILRWTHALVFVEIAIIFLLLFDRYRKAKSSIDKNRLIFALFPSVWSTLIAAYSFSPISKTRTYGYLALLAIQYVLFLTAVKRQFTNFVEISAKLLHAAVMSVLIMLVFIGLVFWARRQPNLLLFNILVASLVIYILFRPLDRKLEWVISGFLRGEGRHIVRKMDVLAEYLSKINLEEDAIEATISGLSMLSFISKAAIYKLNEQKTELILRGCSGDMPLERIAKKNVESVIQDFMQYGYILKIRVLEELEWLSLVGEDYDPRQKGSLLSALELLRKLDSDILMIIPANSGCWGLLCVKYTGYEKYIYLLVRSLFKIVNRLGGVFDANEIAKSQREKDRLALLGELSAGLAHEIRNPLGAIRGAVDLIEPQSDEQEEFLEIIQEEVERLDSLVSKFLDFASPVAVQLEAVELTEVIDRAWKLIDKTNNVSVDFERKKMRVVAEKGLMIQVLINIFKNAIEASATRIEVNFIEDERFVRVVIRDNGMGMDKDVLENIFRPFVTTKTKGTGLGMSVTKKIIDAFGGTISVESTKAQGTVVVITLKKAV